MSTSLEPPKTGRTRDPIATVRTPAMMLAASSVRVALALCPRPSSTVTRALTRPRVSGKIGTTPKRSSSLYPAMYSPGLPEFGRGANACAIVGNVSDAMLPLPLTVPSIGTVWPSVLRHTT